LNEKNPHNFKSLNPKKKPYNSSDASDVRYDSGNTTPPPHNKDTTFEYITPSTRKTNGERCDDRSEAEQQQLYIFAKEYKQSTTYMQ
jgi:hypothetical protein